MNQVIRIEDVEILRTLHEIPISQDRPGAAEQGVFVNQGDAKCRVLSPGPGPDLIRKMMGVDENFPHAQGLANFKPD